MTRRRREPRSSRRLTAPAGADAEAVRERRRRPRLGPLKAVVEPVLVGVAQNDQPANLGLRGGAELVLQQPLQVAVDVPGWFAGGFPVELLKRVDVPRPRGREQPDRALDGGVLLLEPQ